MSLEKLDLKTLQKRAKKLYFDKIPELKEIFVDDFGRFSYDSRNLIEVNRITMAKVYKISRESVSNLDASDVKDLSEQVPAEEVETPKAAAPKKAAPKKAAEKKGTAKKAEAPKIDPDPEPGADDGEGDPGADDEPKE